jgi:8-oxo-dGTP pyrophosphatase MutT (NUDIX family)
MTGQSHGSAGARGVDTSPQRATPRVDTSLHATSVAITMASGEGQTRGRESAWEREIAAIAAMQALELEQYVQQNNAPFCAGVVVLDQGKLLLGLSKKKRWRADHGHGCIIPVTWIGGSQEPGESLRECAAREAREELGCEVSLQHSRRTFCAHAGTLHGTITEASTCAPVLIDMYPGSTTAYAPGLPVGPVIYVAIYKAVLEGEPGAGDLPGILSMDIEDVFRMERGELSLDVLRRQGKLRVGTGVPDEDALGLSLNDYGPERSIVKLFVEGHLA